MEKTTKKKLAREIKNVMCGVSGHTHIIFGKKNGKWYYETGINKFEKSDFKDFDFVGQKNHCCNEITLREVQEFLDDSECYI